MRINNRWSAVCPPWLRYSIRHCVIAMLLLMGLSQQAMAQFTCDSTLYLSQAGSTDGQLYRINRAANPFTFPAVGAASVGINAMGYNPADNYLYALRTQSTAEGTRLYRIDQTGALIDLGLVSGLPAPTGSAYFAGAFTAANDNMLYVMTASGGNLMYKINVTTATASPITLSRSIYFADMDYANGLFYAYETAGQLVSINPNNGTITNIGPAGPARTFGAFYADVNGLYGVWNSGGFYRFDVSTGQQTLISDAPPSGGNDGARCPLGPPLTFNADLAITKTDSSATYVPGANVVYTIVASNNGPFGAQNARVKDALPAGISTASWTCTAASGAACRTASGVGAIDARVDLPYNTSGTAATATFTLTMAVPASFTGTLANTATVAVGVANTDPVATNNSATDTDVAAARVTVGKLSLGGTDAFAFTGSNGIAAQTLTTTTAGTAVNGTPQVLTSLATATTITEGALPAGYVLSSIACTGLPGGTATPNLATRTVTLDAAATVSGANITCTFTNTRNPLLRLQKSLPIGRAVAADQFTLNMTGMASLTTTGSGSTAAEILTHSGATAGASYTLSETAAGATNLAYYATTYSCTNALAGGQAPSGAATGFAVTLVPGDDLTCTLSNRAMATDLQVVKTVSPAGALRAGQVATFTLVATNNGPAAANGAVIRDIPVGLDCGAPATTANCSASGGASCPSATIPLSNLTGSGITLPLLPAGGAVTLTMQCTVLP